MENKMKPTRLLTDVFYIKSENSNILINKYQKENFTVFYYDELDKSFIDLFELSKIKVTANYGAEFTIRHDIENIIVLNPPYQIANKYLVNFKQVFIIYMFVPFFPEIFSTKFFYKLAHIDPSQSDIDGGSIKFTPIGWNVSNFLDVDSKFQGNELWRLVIRCLITTTDQIVYMSNDLFELIWEFIYKDSNYRLISVIGVCVNQMTHPLILTKLPMKVNAQVHGLVYKPNLDIATKYNGRILFY